MKPQIRQVQAKPCGVGVSYKSLELDSAFTKLGCELELACRGLSDSAKADYAQERARCVGLTTRSRQVPMRKGKAKPPTPVPEKLHSIWSSTVALELD